jgi:FtsH-binding integral membrane protein
MHLYEHRSAPLLSRAKFLRRVTRHVTLGLLVVAFALAVGVFGYHFIAHLRWVDSLLNASMILGGMGPVDPLKSDAAKIFASFYALFSGLAFVGIASLMLAPFAHRLLHQFHLSSTKEG